MTTKPATDRPRARECVSAFFPAIECLSAVVFLRHRASGDLMLVLVASAVDRQRRLVGCRSLGSLGWASIGAAWIMFPEKHVLILATAMTHVVWRLRAFSVCLLEFAALCSGIRSSPFKLSERCLWKYNRFFCSHLNDCDIFLWRWSMVMSNTWCSLYATCSSFDASFAWVHLYRGKKFEFDAVIWKRTT